MLCAPDCSPQEYDDASADKAGDEVAEPATDRDTK